MASKTGRSVMIWSLWKSNRLNLAEFNNFNISHIFNKSSKKSTSEMAASSEMKRADPEIWGQLETRHPAIGRKYTEGQDARTRTATRSRTIVGSTKSRLLSTRDRRLPAK